ncbi:MAG: HipA domain-containing protein [Pseudomonadota bacterium]
MSMKLRVWDTGRLIGELEHDGDYNRYSFEYSRHWAEAGNPLSPKLPLARSEETSAERHSADVRNFFQNLLPEGRALDDAASTHNISKANLAGLLHALGRESTGAFMFTSDTSAPYDKPEAPPRALSYDALSKRIQARPHKPFTVWDGRLRLSIAGYQDKLAVLQFDGEWFLPECAQHSSTHILKPEPVNPLLAGMTTNELMCMLLAESVKLSVAETHLVHVPEPVLVIQRFDRKYVAATNTVWRLQCIDGCQALGLPVDFKYEQPYGDGEDVKDIRDGASVKQFFALLNNKELMRATGPAKLAFLRWVIFQVLIGNTDAHAKNLTFFSDSKRLALAPAYDLVSGLALIDADVTDSLAMAVGDNFSPRGIRAYDWALMAHECKIAPKLVVNVLTVLASQCLKQLPDIRQQVLEQGGDARMVERVSEVVYSQCTAALSGVDEIMAIGLDNF